jgi:hypothetical protein
VSSQDDAVRRALSALRTDEAIEHPGQDVLEAYVEGRLSPEDRQAVDRLAAQSAIVAEDLADLQAVHQVLSQGRQVATATPREEGPVEGLNIQWGRIAAAAAVAASILVGVWLTRPAPATLTVPQQAASALTADEQARVTSVLTAGRIVLAPQIAALNPPEGTLLGATAQPPRFRLRAPTGTAVMTPRPAFTWDDAGADAYTIAVFDQTFSEVARARISATTWVPDTDLPRGSTYAWQVTAHFVNSNDTEPKPPRPEARFTVVDAATAEKLAALRARLSDEPLSLGVLLAEAGLIADARVALARAADMPESSALAQRLIDSLNQGTPITTKPAQ